MALKINLARTFIATVLVSIEDAGEIITGDFKATFKMPLLSERDAELESSKALMSALHKLKDAKSEDLEALTKDVEALVDEQKQLLKKRLVKVDELDIVDAQGQLLTGQALIDAVVNDLELAKALSMAYGEAIEKKTMKSKLKNETSETTFDSSSVPETPEAVANS